jgi:cytoskeletal protein CcmA (bactofilin family)
MNQMLPIKDVATVKFILKGLIVSLLVLGLITFQAALVLAFDARSGNIVSISSSEVIEGDLYVAGGTIIIDGTIDGDLIAAGRTILVNGTVNGSIIAAGETVNINGVVSHSVRIAGNTLSISSTIGSDLLVAGREFSMASPAKIGGDLLFGAATAHLGGLVEGNVKSGVRNLTIVSTTHINGKLHYLSENEALIQSGAQISGEIFHQLPDEKKGFEAGMSLWWTVIGFFMSLLLGIILILLAPRWVKEITVSIRTHPWASLGWGALILIATPIFALIVCITVIGLPLGLITFVFYVIAIYITQILVGLLIGQWIVGAFREINTKITLVVALALGLAILRLLRLIPLVGFFVGLATVLFGLGALLISIRK